MTSIRFSIIAMLAVPVLLLAARPLSAQVSTPDLPPMFPLGISAPIAAKGDDDPADRSHLGEIPPGVIQLDGGTSGDGRKSVGLGVLYSLLLPGMGELYAGGYGSGKYFTAAEGVLWLTLGAIDIHARSLQDGARSYAALHAGFDEGGKDDAYYINIGNFTDVWAYNEQVLRDRDIFKLYDPESSSYWSWDSDVNRDLYREQRVASDQMFNNTRFVFAAIAVNHVLSAINAARLIVAGNNALAPGESLDIGANVLGGVTHPHGIALSITHRF